MSHALITGGAGSIGLHLARRLLSANWRVTLLDNFQRGLRDDELRVVLKDERVAMLDLDLGDRATIDAAGRGYSHIFHLAAFLGVQNVLSRPLDVLESNVGLTIAALAIGRRQEALERLVFASTSEVYAGSLEHIGLPVPTPETVPLALPALNHPRTSYMLSKIYGEALCLHSGLPITVVRPHNVYGPRMGRNHVIPELLERAHRLADGEPFEVYSVDHTRTFCYVDDAVEMFYLLATSAAAHGRTANVGTEQPEIRIGDLARMILAAVGRSARIEAREPTAGSPPRRAPDMTLCSALTGYRSRTSLETGIAQSYAWYRTRVFDVA